MDEDAKMYAKLCMAVELSGACGAMLGRLVSILDDERMPGMQELVNCQGFIEGLHSMLHANVHTMQDGDDDV